MLLAVDVGNTNITFALFQGEKLLTNFRMTTKQPRTSDEFGYEIRGMILSNDLDPDQVTGIIVASVVPKIMHSLGSALVKYFNAGKPIVVEAGIKTGLKMKMDNPKSVGADKIVDAVAAYELYGGPAIVVDFGTATTYDIVTADCELLAGVIAPGVQSSASSLWGETAQLPEVEIKRPKSIMGKDTVSCMQAGVFYGQLGQMEYIIKAMKEECGIEDIKVVATGGLGNIFKKETKAIDIYDPNLTMHGLRIIYDKQKR